MTRLITDVISALQRKASIPQNDKKFNITGTYEAYIDDALLNDVYPLLTSLNENYNLVTTSISLTSTSYPQGIIPLPPRAYGQTIREVKWRSDSNNTLINIPQVSLEDSDIYNYTTNSRINGFYMLADSIKLVGNRDDDFDNLDGELFIHYVPSPASVSQDSTIEAEITNISYSSGTTTITLASVGTGLNTYIADSGTKLIDINNKDTGSIKIPSLLVTRSSTTLTTTAMTEDQVTQLKSIQFGGMPLATGYNASLVVTPEAQTPRTPVSKVVDEYLEMSVLSKMMQAIKDLDGYGINEKERKRVKENLINVIGNRVVGEPKKITNRRGIGSYTNNGWRRW